MRVAATLFFYLFMVTLVFSALAVIIGAASLGWLIAVSGVGMLLSSAVQGYADHRGQCSGDCPECGRGDDWR